MVKGSNMNYEITQIRIDKVKVHLQNMRMSNYKYNTWAWDYWCDVLSALEQKKKGLLH
tara:strand:+ start:526 stop:699 length:174 start_codon:yes stop_codon:yes gene_type:complete